MVLHGRSERETESMHTRQRRQQGSDTWSGLNGYLHIAYSIMAGEERPRRLLLALGLDF